MVSLWMIYAIRIDRYCKTALYILQCEIECSDPRCTNLCVSTYIWLYLYFISIHSILYNLFQYAILYIPVLVRVERYVFALFGQCYGRSPDSPWLQQLYIILRAGGVWPNEWPQPSPTRKFAGLRNDTGVARQFLRRSSWAQQWTMEGCPQIKAPQTHGLEE